MGLTVYFLPIPGWQAASQKALGERTTPRCCASGCSQNWIFWDLRMLCLSKIGIFGLHGGQRVFLRNELFLISMDFYHIRIQCIKTTCKCCNGPFGTPTSSSAWSTRRAFGSLLPQPESLCSTPMIQLNLGMYKLDPFPAIAYREPSCPYSPWNRLVPCWNNTRRAMGV